MQSQNLKIIQIKSNDNKRTKRKISKNMSGLHENANHEMANQKRKREQKEKDLVMLAKAKEQEKNKKGKYVGNGKTWRFVAEKPEPDGKDIRAVAP